MDTISRRIRGVYRAAFSSDETRIITVDRYVSGWDASTLRRIFRVRPLLELSGLELQPDGELMLSRHRTGHYALMEARTGVVVATCGEGRRFVSDTQFALSACGRFVIEAAWGRLDVREISTNEVRWSRPCNVRRIQSLQEGQQWALFFDKAIEVWSWPFGQTPVRTIPLPGFSYTVSACGTLVAHDWRREIRVVDVANEQPVFSIARDDVVGFVLSDDGSLAVTKRGRLEVYGRDGALTGALDAPELSTHGHAFGASGDAAVLCYLDGIVRVRGLPALLDRGTELPAPWTSPEPGDEEHVQHILLWSPPDERSTVEAETPAALEAELDQFRRPAWVPALRAERGPTDGSKFGGVPWLADSEEWPRCGRCGGRMDLFLQLNSEDLPEDCPQLFEGLLQVFVCTYATYSSGTCSVPHDAFSNWGHVRIVGEHGGSARYVDPPDEDLFDEQRIVGWTRQNDFPDFDELERMGVNLGRRARKLQMDREFAFPRSGDKLLGWARWEQGAELVGCPRCGEAMRILFQIDACCGVPVMLGDGGIGWVCQCAQHPDVVTFHWSCG